MIPNIITHTPINHYFLDLLHFQTGSNLIFPNYFHHFIQVFLSLFLSFPFSPLYFIFSFYCLITSQFSFFFLAPNSFISNFSSLFHVSLLAFYS